MLVLIALICFLPLNANVAFRDGEKLVFTVKYGIVSAAEATLEAKSSSMNGRSAWNLSTDARTYPFFDAFFKVRDRVDSWWDKETLLPIKYTKNLQEGKYRQRRIHTFDHSNNTTNYQKYSFRQGIYKSEDMKMLANSQDVLSAFYHVRNQNLKPKQRLRVNITSDGRTMNTEIIVHRREKVKTIFGDINCLVIEPKLISGAVFKQTGRIIIWITDDAYKIPVKMESAVSFGSFVAELKEAYNVPYKVK
ncbi:MAG TPA: DUF3108 domain-containing protein [Candidatus Cloacimonetes bacterium]|jgi:hypothetical protein|nr:DUF3108 domain-containing protein [Candidatus Cloacimonadota bacterium]